MLIWYMLNSVLYRTSLDTLEAKTNNISVMNVWLKAITIYKICGVFISKNNVKHLIFIQQLYRHDVHTEVNHIFALFDRGTARTNTLLHNWSCVIIIIFWALWFRNVRSPFVRQLQSPCQRRIQGGMVPVPSFLGKMG